MNAEIAAAALLAVAAHLAVLTYAAATAWTACASNFSVFAKASASAQFARRSFLPVGAYRTSFANYTIAADHFVLANAFTAAVDTQPLQLPMAANSTTSAILAL